MNGFGTDLGAMSPGWLATSPDDPRQRCPARADRVTFQKGQVLCSGPNPLAGMDGVLAGSRGVTNPQPGGGRCLAHVFRPGWWFGEGAMVDGGRRRIGVPALEASTGLSIPTGRVGAVLQATPAVRVHVTRVALTNPRIAFTAVGDHMIRQGDSRIAAVLLRVTGARDGSFLAPDHGTMALRATGTLSLAQGMLARVANASRDLVIRSLTPFEAMGWVRLGYNRIAVAGPHALAGFAHGARSGVDLVEA